MRGLQLRLLSIRDLAGRYAAVFRLAWSRRREMDQRRHSREEAEFLPAALSLQETPVSPAPRVAMWLLVAFAGIAVAWAALGQVDIVVTAQGKIVPSGRTKIIQPLEYAIVRSILVEDGQTVRAGDILIELDERSATADVDRVEADVAAYTLQEARGRALRDALRGGRLGTLAAQPGVEPTRLAETQRLLLEQYTEYRAKLESLEAEIGKRHAELDSLQPLIGKLEQTVPIARQRAADFKAMAEANYVAQHNYLEREQARIEQESDLANLRGRSAEIDAGLRAARAQQAALTAETARAAQDLVNDAQQKLAALRQDRAKARAHAGFMRLTAPVDGVVQQLAVHTVGGVVTPAQPLMSIVPKEDQLEVEAALENKDAGFVRVGQSAAVKVEAFEYTKYGTIPAVTSDISRDAVADEKKGLLFFTLGARMERSTLQVGERNVQLTPGMAVTVEIKTGRRRVIEYFLSPLLQYANESLTER